MKKKKLKVFLKINFNRFFFLISKKINSNECTEWNNNDQMDEFITKQKKFKLKNLNSLSSFNIFLKIIIACMETNNKVV